MKKILILLTFLIPFTLNAQIPFSQPTQDITGYQYLISSTTCTNNTTTTDCQYYYSTTSNPLPINNSPTNIFHGILLMLIVFIFFTFYFKRRYRHLT
jgi:hypothetical protein